MVLPALRELSNQLTSMLVLLLLTGLAFAGQQEKQGPAAGCVGCHSSQARTQLKTDMARAMQLSASSSVLQSHPRLTFQKFGYTYVVETKDGESTYSVSDGTQTITLPIRWSFGVSAQTWVFERNGVYYESLVSYYPSINGLEITTGDSDITPTTLEQAVGRMLSAKETKACFGCHTTGAIVDGVLKPTSLEPGVTCEHCHAGSTAHMFSAAQGEGVQTAPPDLRKLTSEDLSNFCGQCHTTWETVVRGPMRGALNTRFQPFGLANSKCFSGTDARISCIACHDPHINLVTDMAAYDGKCLACHSTGGSSPVATHRPAAKTCPVATKNCASCHMPAVKMPNGLASFHDHMIRVVKPGVTAQK